MKISIDLFILFNFFPSNGFACWEQKGSSHRQQEPISLQQVGQLVQQFSPAASIHPPPRWTPLCSRSGCYDGLIHVLLFGQTLLHPNRVTESSGRSVVANSGNGGKQLCWVNLDAILGIAIQLKTGVFSALVHWYQNWHRKKMHLV